MRGQGETQLFSGRAVIKCFGIPPRSNIIIIKKPRFQGARPDHVRVKSSTCYFPKELVSFVRRGELVNLDP